MADIEKLINELVDHIESALAVDSDYVDCVRTDTLQTVVGLLKEQQPKKGRWRKSLHLSSQKYYMICSCCEYECQGWDGETGVAYDYCPNCGAEMQNGNTNRDYKKDGEQE